MTPLRISLELEDDGRWIGAVDAMPGVLAYGTTCEDARASAQALALRVLADRIEHAEFIASKDLKRGDR